MKSDKPKGLSDDYGRLSDLLLKNEDWLMERILYYAKDRGYAKYTSTLKEPWRMSISGLSQSFLKAIANNSDLELKPEEDYMRESAAHFGIVEARRHRQRGVDLAMFLGLMKYYRQSYLDLMAKAQLPLKDHKRFCLLMERFFDRVEIGLCTEWTGATLKKRIQELQQAARLMTNEKNKYLTIFESHPSPIIILNNKNNIENMNHAALNLLQESSVPVAQYYTMQNQRHLPDDAKDPPDPASGFSNVQVDSLFPWMAEEIETFKLKEDPVSQFEKQVSLPEGMRYFAVKFSKMRDVSGKFTGMIVCLEDLTFKKQVEEECLKTEKLQGVLEMAGAVCHELNQPLQVVMGTSEILMLKMDADDPLNDVISNIRDQVERLGLITKRLSRITRYETQEYLNGKIIDINKASEIIM